MTPESVMSLGIQAIKLGLMVAGPLLLAALATGLIISILQAATQINEMTMTFIPKILVIIGVAVVLGPWMMRNFIEYTRLTLTNIPFVIG
ncbi:flagellar biosynthesis protein FliQ [Erwinia amylovora]|uniref:Flagellar biosynthetic protein FliQ n=4 Tax=Erwinia amylovora TaxID=552 RepID=A0A831A392_ERWAM|nr:flagellar biosynthesis protein FliQ [Erwinia amylovora]CBX81564.1 Flagellar biosynthetic protein FliQ [Erwinia amylovora ATCC BAA-2158]CCP03999.1 Flagellar biosynthetic protein FliQ [Erwinia amylovora Ea644]CCP08063.1 Flagellar biosynthetic protein FliQ [Erwinia amylovora MR1]CDK16073.1 Flagellar biosynthetic protein FliQ [Erwinia amylovora LA635]CDK19440.1 Flagellar biosynthetic protein FliQ [Erwinia amylovora LA636]CDK22811.1 Flagellar biosynthetic protein FliQ [Erwinia amylovora LA637]